MITFIADPVTAPRWTRREGARARQAPREAEAELTAIKETVELS